MISAHRLSNTQIYFREILEDYVLLFHYFAKLITRKQYCTYLSRSV